MSYVVLVGSDSCEGQDACVAGADVAVADGDFEAVYVTGDGTEAQAGKGGLQYLDYRVRPSAGSAASSDGSTIASGRGQISHWTIINIKLQLRRDLSRSVSRDHRLVPARFPASSAPGGLVEKDHPA
jgi:hypothetical protein